MRCVFINLSCYLPTFCSITSDPKCQSSNQNGPIISYPCKDFQMYFYFCLFVKLQHNVTGKLPLFSVIWRFLRLAPLAGAKNFFYIVSYIFGKPIQFRIKCRARVICSLKKRGKKCAYWTVSWWTAPHISGHRGPCRAKKMSLNTP